MLIVRDLPGIADLEVKLLLQRNAYEGAEEDFCKSVSMELFGVWPTETDYDEHYDDLFNSYELSDDEMMAAMLSLGVDFSDERGNPLRCTRWLAEPAEIAARAIAGRMPEGVDRFASNLQAATEAFMNNKCRGK